LPQKRIQTIDGSPLKISQLAQKLLIFLLQLCYDAMMILTRLLIAQLFEGVRFKYILKDGKH
jgi:hypothetical protein